MGAGGPDTSHSEELAEMGNMIAMLQYMQSQQQYAEQKKEKDDTKASAKANAAAVYKGNTFSYANFDKSHNRLSNANGDYSLLRGMPTGWSALGDSSVGTSDKLGG